MKTILIVDDDKNVINTLSLALSDYYHVIKSYSGIEALELFNKVNPDLIILDLNLGYGKIDGYELCRVIKKKSPLIPVLMLTGVYEPDDEIYGFSTGADDFIIKPFNISKLLTRVECLLKKKELNTSARKNPANILENENIYINRNTFKVEICGKPIDLTRSEFDLLYILMKNIDKLTSREYLYMKIIGTKAAPRKSKSLEMHLVRLRKKIGPLVSSKIKVVVGKGYKLCS